VNGFGGAGECTVRGWIAERGSDDGVAMFEENGGGLGVVVEEAEEFEPAIASVSDDAHGGHE